MGTLSQTSFDLLTLGPGDAVRVEFEPTAVQLGAMTSIDRRIQYLVARGYPTLSEATLAFTFWLGTTSATHIAPRSLDSSQSARSSARCSGRTMR